MFSQGFGRRLTFKVFFEDSVFSFGKEEGEDWVDVNPILAFAEKKKQHRR